MKVTHRIPTTQYGYVEVESEVETLDPVDIHEKHDWLINTFAAKDSELPQKEWNATVDAVLKNELKLTPEAWERMSQYQQNFLQEIKRSRNRA